MGGGGGCSCQPICSSAEEEEEEPGRGSPQPATVPAVARESGQEPPQFRVADYTTEVSGADEGYQTPGEAGGSGGRGDC